MFCPLKIVLLSQIYFENIPGGSRTLLQCLRSVPLHRLMRFRPESSSPFRPVWGPSYDGVVVHSFRHRMRDYLERMAR